MIITRTPYRISFFGGGTDYPSWFKEHPGAVLATSIDKYCYVTCRRLPAFFDHRSRIVYSTVEEVRDNGDIRHPVVRETLRYLDVRDGVEIHHDGDLPARSGIGTSSSFTVGLLHALYALRGGAPTKVQLSRDAIRIEQELLRENVGSQDQVTAAFGGFNRIDFHPDGSFTVAPLSVPKGRMDDLLRHLILLFAGQARLASDVAKEQVENTARNTRLLERLYALVDEARIVLQGDTSIEAFGDLLHETWTLKRQLSSRIATPLIDEAYEAARMCGARGGKLLGAGSGGFLLIFADPGSHDAIIRRLNPFFTLPFQFESSGTMVIFDGSAAREAGREPVRN